MPLVTLQEALDKTVRQRYAVGSFNITNHQFVEGILQAAEEQQVPVILSVAEVHFRYLNLELFIPYVHDRIRRSSVPVVLHLDHGTRFETILKAIHLGFSSVMIDGSRLSYQGNLELTKQVVDVAHPVGVSVEAELGCVGGGEGNFEEGSEADPSAFTDPIKAQEFVEQTGIEALAVAVGTVHGPYKGKPQIDLELISKIRDSVDIPLVLHGGSGLSDQDFQQVVERGINKVNFYTQNSLLAVEEIRKLLNTNPVVDFPTITSLGQQVIYEQVKHQISVFQTKPVNRG